MLKSLELFGFKSFADRTRFDFAPGVTGVVGPNGSGKSNVVDAIKWILGDQSPKSLRGKGMADVIFNGAAGRKATGFAEATLTFDNTSGFLPLESQEVQIGRRLWQSGEAEYLINNSPARLKDVRNLLMGTGAGASAYCIIEQGRVDQILQASASTRRTVFEEAAGISRYKSRRAEAHRKLERVDQNLLRLQDIVDEVDARLNSLRNQAAKAARYRELAEELRAWWLGLAADDYRRLSTQLDEAEAAARKQAENLEQLNARQRELEEQRASTDDDIAEIDRRLQEIERRRAKIGETIAGQQTTLRHQSARLEELESERDRLRGQRRLMAARVREGEEKYRQTKQELDRFEGEFQQQQTELEAREEQIRQVSEQIEAERNRIEQQREDVFAQMRLISEKQNRVTALESQLQTARATCETAQNRRDELDESLRQQEEICSGHRNDVETARGKLAEAEESLREVRQRRESLIAEQERFHRRLTELREERSAAEARRNVLQDLEDRQEGLSIGVREILRRARTVDEPPWNRIAGSVADLLDVDLEHAPVLEIALGNRSQLLVTTDRDSLVEYLSSDDCHISGRVGFLAISEDGSSVESIETDGSEKRHLAPRDVVPFAERADDSPTGPADGSEAPIADHPGVIDRVDRLTRSADAVPGLAGRLLADTWVVDTLQTAFELAHAGGGHDRFVTLQGELLDADGVLYVGLVRSETALVSRKSELRNLKRTLQQLDESIETEQKRLGALDGSLAEIDAERETAETEVQNAQDRLSQAENTLTGAEQELKRIGRDRGAAEAERTGAEERIGQLQHALQDAQMEQARAEEDLQSLQSEISRAERELFSREHRLRTLRQRRDDDQFRLARQEERLEGLRESVRRCDEDRQQRVEQYREAERRLEAGLSKQRETVLHILQTRALLAEQFLTEQELAERADRENREKDLLRSRREELLSEEAGLRDQSREFSEAQHQAEMRAGEIRHQIQAVEQRIDEEFQQNLSEVVESGASALQLYRESDDGAEDAAFEEVREEIEEHVNRLRRKLKVMGSVDTDSLDDLEELERRFDHLSHQLEDLKEAKQTLEEIVRRINAHSEQKFSESFESIREHFRELFRKLFGGGEADIVLEDPEDLLECGIDVVARPPGKELRSISLLSGGEKTMTAVALLLAIFKSRPSPFCILDEVDAALDEANLDRFVAVVREFQQSTQFIMITHRKPSMAAADVLYGVTMEESGVSKRMSVRFEDVNENGEFTPSGGSGRMDNAA